MVEDMQIRCLEATTQASYLRAIEAFAGFLGRSLAYLSRYTHRVAIANSRLIAADTNFVTFRCKDYRANGRNCQKLMRLETGEFIRRFLLHVLPTGFHRIRHYGLFANSARVRNVETVRRLLHAEPPDEEPAAGDTEAADAVAVHTLRQPCPCCGGPMIIIETFERGQMPRARAPPARRAA
jgi:hypothetical protein